MMTKAGLGSGQPSIIRINYAVLRIFCIIFRNMLAQLREN